MIVDCQIARVIHSNENFQLVGAIPIGEHELVLHPTYRTFTIKDTGHRLVVNKNYTLEVEEQPPNKYGTQYLLKDIPSLSFDKIDDITDDMELELLQEIMNKQQAKYVHEAYPNFIRLVMKRKASDIDVDRIYNVSTKRLEKYISKVGKKYNAFLLQAQLKEIELTQDECSALLEVCEDIDGCVKLINKQPYYALVNICKRGFRRADVMILSHDIKHKYSTERIEYMLQYAIEQFEVDGSTYVDAVRIGDYIATIDSDILSMIKDVAIESEMIMYDEERNILQRTSTYKQELRASEFFKDIMLEEDRLDWDWTKYTKIKDGELTDEQHMLLKEFCNHRVVVMDAPAGCVDSETEFFNGYGWKRIADYNEGDKVLQYNHDGTTSLVEPWRYIKKPCNTMYYINTKYGVNQMLTPDHNCIYKTKKGVLQEATAQQIKDAHDNLKYGWEGKFISSFKYDGDGINLTDEEIRVMCAVICDGSFYNAPSHRPSYYRCRFHLKKERKHERIRKLLADAGIQFRESISATKGYIDFYADVPIRTKTFGDIWYKCSQHQLQVICDEILFWDGCTTPKSADRNRMEFATTDKDSADFIQFAFSSCGYRATIYTHDRRGRVRKVGNKTYITKSIEYNVQVTTRTLCGIVGNKSNKPRFDIVAPTDGYKYCFTVPSHMLVLRRNDKIFITGNCGKTSSVMALIDMIEDNDLSYIMMSPTGKAASRLSEQTGRNASTIHRAVFGNMLYDKDVIIIDEASMLSLPLIDMIISSELLSNCRLVFVGDSAQIPPIGLGRVFKDIGESGAVPVVRLTKCFRFEEGGASYVSTLTRQGQFYMTEEQMNQERFTLGQKQDYEFIQFNGDVNQIIDVYMSLIEDGINPKDIMLLVPYNIGSFGATKLNNMIQERLNPVGDDEYMKTKHNNTNVLIHKGDLVMNIKNNYNAVTLRDYRDIEWDDSFELSDAKNTAVYNGQTGYVESVTNEKGVVSGKMLVANIEGEDIVYTSSDINNLLLSYASNPYKYQGSQNKYIINVIIGAHDKAWNRQLLYTSQTRMTDKLIEIGDIDMIREAVSQAGDDNRNTRLKEFLTLS